VVDEESEHGKKSTSVGSRKAGSLSIVLILAMFSLIGCQAAEGLKEDITFIGDKTAEILDK